MTIQAMVRQHKSASKGQEWTTALTLRDCVVSADALHTQPRWCRTILQQQGDYLVIAKRNQSELRQAIALLFNQPPRPLLFPEVTAHSVDKQHGRLAVRHLRTGAELGTYLAPH